MKTLYLVRHAKSSWKDPALDDMDRPLNKRGKRDAPLMGKVLREQGIKPDVLFSSPAARALATARKMAKEIGVAKEDIVIAEAVYGASEEDLLGVIRAIDDAAASAMLFGHNPEFTGLANELSPEPIDNMPTCSVFCVTFAAESWRDASPENAQFEFLDYPKRHA